MPNIINIKKKELESRLKFILLMLLAKNPTKKNTGVKPMCKNNVKNEL